VRALAALAALVAIVVALAFCVMAVFGLGIFSNKVQAQYNKAVLHSKVEQKVNDPTKAITNYEQFFSDCTAIQAANEQIAAARTRLAAVERSPDDGFGQKAGRVADAQADLTGVIQNRASIAARYNAASQQQTRALFKDAGLPAQIGPPYIVTCTAQGGTP
jgi:hypothetical protein